MKIKYVEAQHLEAFTNKGWVLKSFVKQDKSSHDYLMVKVDYDWELYRDAAKAGRG